MDHTTEGMEKVVEDLSRHLGEMVQGWIAKIQEAESLTLDEIEKCVKECSLWARRPCNDW